MTLRTIEVRFLVETALNQYGKVVELEEVA